MQALVPSVLMVIVPMVVFAAVQGVGRTFGFNFFDFIVLAVLLILLHEGTHAVGWKIFGDMPWSALSFGIMWRALAPYVHAAQPMTMRAYRIGAALPLFTSGLAPWLLGTITGSGALAWAGAVMISGAIGDAFVLWVTRDLPDDALVFDHPSRVGCIVVDEGSTPA